MQFSISLQQFLDTVVTTTPVVEQAEVPLWLHVYIRHQGHNWLPWPLTPQCIDYLQDLTANAQQDVYFSPHLYTGINPSVLHGLEDAPIPPTVSPAPTRTIAIDVDNADLMYLPLIGTALVRTSPARHQVYLVFDDEINTTLSKQMAMSIEGSDHLSYRFGHMFRLPFCYNHKYNPPQPVSVVQCTYTVHKLEDLVPTSAATTTYTEENLLIGLPEPPDLKPQAYLESLQLSPTATVSFNTPAVDPRAALTQFIEEMIHRHVPRNNVFFMAWRSANNYFKALAYNQEYELAKLICKLEVAAAKPDMRNRVRRVRSTASTVEERHELIAEVVRESMISVGTFYHTKQGGMWYVPKDSTSSIAISKASSSLHYYLNNTFGLNINDWDTPYVMSDLEAFVNRLPRRATEAKLSWYSRGSNRMLVHTGGGVTYAITPTNIYTTYNGDYGVLFHPMNNIFMPFVPHSGPLTVTRSVPDNTHTHRKLVTTTYDTWNEALFGPFLDNIDGLTHDEANAILTAWFLFLFFKSDAPSRPLLAIFGQPGAGKSTVLKRVSRFLYGKLAGVVGVTTPADYDQQTYEFPLLILDNVDTWEKWLPDRLAQSAGAIDTGRKKLYTDDQTVILTKDAMVAITAHDPKFSRPDIADRLLILKKTRFDTFEDEAEIMQMPRAAMWHNMMQDLSHILSTPRPIIPEQLRVQDFASIGSWIANGIGLLPSFQSALVKLRGAQRTFALDNDQVMLDACVIYATKSPTSHVFKPLIQLYNELELMYGTVGDPQQFQRKYRNPAQFGTKLNAAQDALSNTLNIETSRDEFGRATWRITKKE